jgi:hypothetical protein
MWHNVRLTRSSACTVCDNAGRIRGSAKCLEKRSMPTVWNRECWFVWQGYHSLVKNELYQNLWLWFCFIYIYIYIYIRNTSMYCTEMYIYCACARTQHTHTHKHTHAHTHTRALYTGLHVCWWYSYSPPPKATTCPLWTSWSPPPSCGRSVTDFWGWDAHDLRLRFPDEVGGNIWIWSARFR